MATPDSTLIENIVIALIQTEAPFTNASNAPVLNWDRTNSLLPHADRVVVEAGKPIPLVPARSPDRPAPVMQCPVTVHAIVATNNVTKLDTWEAALDTALANNPSAANTAANNSFPDGFVVDDVQAGDRQQEGAEQRRRTLTLRVVFRT